MWSYFLPCISYTPRFYFIEGNVFKLGTCFHFDSSQFKTYLKALNSFVILLARIYA